jgi:hypothetical protein
MLAKSYLAVALTVSLSACGHFTGKNTRETINNQLKVGMSKQEVIDLLGNAYLIDRPQQDADVELMYYEIESFAAKFCLQYTPILLMDNKVKAWGTRFCKEPDASSQQVELIDTNLKQ